ncbi:MAG: DUF4349 domain-containing protein [Lachnospiraceae bacterium]|nr:DUF4349 domain-containing protein [Lachnospiraceae bacterium]
MKKAKRYVVGLCAALTMLVLTGCGGKASSDMAIAETMAASSMQMNSSMQMDGSIYEAGVELDKGAGMTEGAREEEASSESSTYRKLIKTVSMDVETEEFDNMMTNLKNRVEELNGYIESSSVRGNSRYNENRYADMTIRIPQDKLDYFVNEVAEISNITWKSENVEDITLTYVDIESRKKALEIEQERLLSLLEKAESVEDIISIESRLSEVRYELQSYASQLLVYDNQVNYSTVYLNISEVKRLTPQEEPTVWNRIAIGFTDNLGGVARLIENIFVGVIVLIPYWGLWVIVVVVLIGVCKGISAAQKKKREKKEKKD